MKPGRPTDQARFAEPRREAVNDLCEGYAVADSTPGERLMAASLMLADGMTRFEIACRLDVSLKTMSRYVEQIRSAQ